MFSLFLKFTLYLHHKGIHILVTASSFYLTNCVILRGNLLSVLPCSISGILTYLCIDLDVLDPVECVLVAMSVLAVEVILSHQGGLLGLGGVAQWSEHVHLSPRPHQQYQDNGETQRIHVCKEQARRR